MQSLLSRSTSVDSERSHTSPPIAPEQDPSPDIDAFLEAVFPADDHDVPKWWETEVADLLHRLGYTPERTRVVLDLSAMLGSVECIGEVDCIHKDAVERLLPDSPAWFSPRYDCRCELGVGAAF